MKYRNFLKDKNNKGFTLIELVVVLVIIALLAAITVPVVTGYIEDAREAEDYAKIGILNRSSSAYRAFVYQDNPTQVDVFEGIEDNKVKQEKLVEKNLLDEVLTSRKGGYFSWNVEKQLWELGDGSSPSVPSFTDVGTIMDQSRNKEAPDLDSNKESYKSGDLFTFNGEIYKLTGDYKDKINGNLIPYCLSLGVIKKIKLAYDSTNPYQFGDIIQHQNGCYYKALYTDSANASYYVSTHGKLDPDNLNSQIWVKVVQDSSNKWIEEK